MHTVYTVPVADANIILIVGGLLTLSDKKLFEKSHVKSEPFFLLSSMVCTALIPVRKLAGGGMPVM